MLALQGTVELLQVSTLVYQYVTASRGKFTPISAVVLVQKLQSRCVGGTPRCLVLVSRTWVRPASCTLFSSACSRLSIVSVVSELIRTSMFSCSTLMKLYYSTEILVGYNMYSQYTEENPVSTSCALCGLSTRCLKRSTKVAVPTTVYNNLKGKYAATIWW